MSAYQIDPLDGIEARPIEVQVAVLASEMRNQRNSLNALRLELKTVKTALWGLVVAIMGGAGAVVLTIVLTRPAA